MHTYIHACTHTYDTYIQTYRHTYTTYIHTYMSARARTHTHTHTHKSTWTGFIIGAARPGLAAAH